MKFKKCFGHLLKKKASVNSWLGKYVVAHFKKDFNKILVNSQQ